LFAIQHVTGVELGEGYIVVRRSDAIEWPNLKPSLLVAIMDHYTAGRPAVSDSAIPDGAVDDPIVTQIKDLIETRIMPVVAKDGGEVVFRAFNDGDVVLELQGSALRLIGGIENMLRHYIPEVIRVVNHLDSIPKPGLDTPEAKDIQQLLDDEINPSVAGHGGHISLVDVKDNVAYIRLEGGCQGCGMADVTLKQGVEVAIKNKVPAIVSVLDTTDHAGGSNPYFSPGKGGASAY
jgi:Fe-S cluster biogenesis protein NfuA